MKIKIRTKKISSPAQYVSMRLLCVCDKKGKLLCWLNMGITRGRRQSKMLIPSTNVNKKSLETEFLIAIFRLTGDKWQSKTLFLAIFDLCTSIVKRVFVCRLPGVGIMGTKQVQHPELFQEQS